ncbi:MAG: type 1 glutamine amidotransferase [Thermoleophilia bacterium]|nr:type 1 glutamine amidotransferase [Thermoleophilia bacterium]
MRVLSIVHETSSTAGGGLFEDVVEQRGDRLERVSIAHDDASALDHPERYDAIMVFGGAMHPDQDAEHPWLADEAAFIRQAIAREVPLFGVCLGGQLIARAAGAEVGRAPRSEVGWHTVCVNEAGLADAVLGVLPARLDAFQWHHYRFDLPDGAELLAENDAANQGYRLGERTWGVQFHPEVTRHMLDYWFIEGGAEIPDLATTRTETDAFLGGWNEHGRALCNAFLDYAAG